MTQSVAGPHLPSLVRGVAVGLLLTLAGLDSWTAQAATYYWDTSSGLWTTGANWSDNPMSGGTTGTVPANDTTSDTAVFNQASVNGNQQVQLSQNQSIAGVVFGNTGSTTVVSNAATVRTLSLGSGGLLVRAGAGSVTIGSSAAPVNVAIDGSQTFTNSSSNPLTFTGTVSRLAAATGTQALTIAGSGTTFISGRLMSGGASGVLNLTKSGMGTLVLNGTASSSFGASTLQGGTTLVDFTNHTTGTNLYSTGDVVLVGGQMLLKGKAIGSTAQTLGTITANPGGGSILADANGGSITVTLGSLSLNAGGTLLVGQAANSTGTVTFTRTTAPASSGAAYGQSLVFTNGTAYDWATSTSGVAPYVLSAFTGYVSLATTAGTDTNQSRITGDTTLTGARTTNSLKIESTAAGQSLALGANTLTLTGGAILATGSNAFTITSSGGIISNGAAVIIQQYNTGGLTIAPRFGGGFTTGFTKAGPGLLTLTSTNNGFTAPIFVNSGTLAIGGAGRLIGTTGTYAGNVTLATEGVFEFASSAASILSGSLSGAGSFRQSGSGATTLLGTNTYTGNTTIVAGTLALGANGSFDSSPTITVGDTGSSGAILDLTAKSSGFTFGSGQTVKGIGTIQMASGKALTINGTLAAGNSPGTLTVAGGDLVLGGSSITSYEINGTNATVGSGTNDLTTVSGSLTLGGTLNVIASPSFDLFGSRTYRVFNYATSGTGSLAGSMAIGTTPDANYLYSLNTATTGQVNLFVQRRAEQAATLAYTLPTSGTVNAFTSTNLSFSGTLANLTPSGGAALGVSLTGTGGNLSVNGLAAVSGGTVAANSSTTVTGTIGTGLTLGTRTWSVVNTDTSAITSTTSSASGVVNVFAHGTPTLSGTTIGFGYVLVGTATSRNVTVSNGALGSPAANTGGITWTSGSLPGGFTGGGANSSGVVASGSGASYSFTLATGSAGLRSGSQTFSFADDSSILGNGSLGSQSVSLSGTVLDPATAILGGGITSGTNWVISLGEQNQGAGLFTQGFTITNLLQSAGYTADLDLLSFAADPLNTAAIGITLSGTSFSTITPGGTNSYQASLSLGTPGTFTNYYNLSFVSSKNGSTLGGTPQNVMLTVTGIIVVPEPGAIALAGIGIAVAGWASWRRRTCSAPRLKSEV